jgi:hypothetical protein
MLKLQDVVNAMEEVSDETQVFYCKKTGEFIFVNEYSGDVYDIEDMDDYLWEQDGVELPSRWEIDEYDMMAEFTDSLEDGGKRAMLSETLRGRGAFRRFKDMAIGLGLIQDWYDYKDRAYGRIASEWCKDNQIEVEG